MRVRRVTSERGSVLPLVLAIVLVMAVVGVAVLRQEASAPSAQSAYGSAQTSGAEADGAADAFVQRVTSDPTWFDQLTPNCADPSQTSYQSMGSNYQAPDGNGGTATLEVMCKALAAPPVQFVSHDLNSYALFATNYIRVNGCGVTCNYSNITGNLGVNTASHSGFSWSINMCANRYLRLSYNSEVVADSMTGDGLNCQLQNTTVFTNSNPLGGTNWTTTGCSVTSPCNPRSPVVRPLNPLPGSSNYIVDFTHNNCPYLLPWPGDSACGPLPAGQTSIDMTGAPGSFNTTGCSGANVNASSTASLPQGVYNNVVIPAGKTLTLTDSGTYTFCSISLSAASSVLQIAKSRTYVLVHQTVNLDGAKVLGPDDTKFFIRGETTGGTSGDTSSDPSLDFGNGTGEQHGIWVVGGDTKCDANGDGSCHGAGKVAMPGTTTLYGHVYARIIVDGGGAGIHGSAPRLVNVKVCTTGSSAGTGDCPHGRALLSALVRITNTDPSSPAATVLSWTRNPS